MFKRRHWGVTIRHLRNENLHHLKGAVARSPRRIRRAILHDIMQGCPNVNPYRPDSLIVAMESNPCVKRRVVEADERYSAFYPAVMYDALYQWGTRNRVSRALMRVPLYRSIYMRSYHSYHGANLLNYLKVVMLKRVARHRRRRLKRRGGIIRKGFVMLMVIFMLLFGGLYMATYQAAIPEERTEMSTILNKTARMIYKWAVE